MNISKRNKNNIISRWNKIHSKEISEINHNSKHKARICGFLAGDGNLTDKRYYIRFFPDHKSLIGPYMESIKLVYDKEPKIRAKNNHFELTLCSKVVYQDLQKQCDFGIKNWNLPSKLLDNQENSIEWLRAFFDAEGYVNAKHIKVSSINKNGLNQVRNLLKILKIHSRIYSYQSKNKNHNETYQLMIYRKNGMRRYKEIVNFNHILKMGKLYKQIK